MQDPDTSCDPSLSSTALLNFARSRWRKVVALLVLAGLAAGAAAVAGSCWSAYSGGRTVGVARMEETAAVAFPVVTVCSRRQYREDVLQAAGIVSRRSYAMEADWVGEGETPAGDIYRSAVIPVEVVVSDLKVFLNTPTLDGQTVIGLSPGGRFCGRQVFRPKEHFYFGRCHSLTVPECLQELGITELVVQVEEAADLYVHQADAFYSPDTRAKLAVAPGQASKVAVTHAVREEVGGCSNEAFDTCLTAALEELLLREVNCTVPWLAGRGAICTAEQDRRRAARVFQENRRNQRGLCRTPCHSTTVGFGPVGLEPVVGAAGRAVLFFPTRVEVERQERTYTAAALSADLAGVLGLLLVLATLAHRVVRSEGLVGRLGPRPRSSVTSLEVGKEGAGKEGKVPVLPLPSSMGHPGDIPAAMGGRGAIVGARVRDLGSDLSRDTTTTTSPTSTMPHSASANREMWAF